jgi:arylsulfatase A-like enzyme
MTIYQKAIPLIVLTSGILNTGCIREDKEKPNFLVILADDLAYRAVGYNNDLVKTPNIDRLAGQGIVFNRAYTASPVCVASRASLLTGLYPQTNGTVALDTESFLKNVVQEKKFKTLPRFLSEAGYVTCLCGKSHLADPKAYGFQIGEETWDYDDQRAFRDASGFINRIANSGDQQPFLLWMAARQPHLPLKPAREWLDLYSGVDIPIDKNFLEKPPEQSFFNQGLPGENFYRDSEYRDNYKNLPAGPPRSPEVIREFAKAYYATISHLDYQVGELVKLMDSKGLMKNTVIIFLSDNGYFLGNHGLGNKLTMHEESVRVPFFVYSDQLKNGGIHSYAFISSLDLFPTILELAGIDIPKYLQGKSLKPLLSDPSGELHKFMVSESVGVGGKLGTGHRMVVRDEWKYMLSDTGDEALFNMRNDLFELNNLIKESRYTRKENDLKSCLKDWKKMTGDKKEIPDFVSPDHY